MGSAQTKDLSPHLFHAGGESFLSPNHRFFTTAQFMINRHSEEGARVGVAFLPRRRLESSHQMSTTLQQASPF
jgi:hypothetical protein